STQRRGRDHAGAVPGCEALMMPNGRWTTVCRPLPKACMSLYMSAQVVAHTGPNNMAELVANCPRCKTQSIAFDADVKAFNSLGKDQFSGEEHYEVFGICRHCSHGTIFVVSGEHQQAMQGQALNQYVKVQGFISLRDQATVTPPEHVPPNIANVFREAATCLKVECWNAAGTMFRLCVDLVTKPMLPKEEVPGLNAMTRRNLGLRLPWLFDNGKLPADLHKLSTVIKEDGNDGAHQGTLTKEDAYDLLDFTTALLGRVFTVPEKIKLAEKRREQRRASARKK